MYVCSVLYITLHDDYFVFRVPPIAGLCRSVKLLSERSLLPELVRKAVVHRYKATTDAQEGLYTGETTIRRTFQHQRSRMSFMRS